MTMVLLFIACAMLAAEPLLWLVGTWSDPSYDSIGGSAAALVVMSFAWSLASGSTRDVNGSGRALAARLLLSTALIRFIGAWLAIKVLGALALVIDVYALGIWFGLGRRRRAVSPLWLAAAFAFALPIERIFQRVIGYGLQQVAATSACGFLDLGFDGIRCDGVRILLDGHDVLVDLPCSGARGLTLLLLFFCITASWKIPTLRGAMLGLLTTIIAALTANALRIAALATFVARPEWLGHADVMMEPLHGAIGALCLIPGGMAVALWGLAVRSRRVEVSLLDESRQHGASLVIWTMPRVLAFTAVACLIVVIPGRPLDVTRAVGEPVLPATLAGDIGSRLPLSESERSYYTQFGGGAAKATYGRSTLLVVRTSSPLRHLHAPDECLVGAGHRVVRSGIVRGALPAAEYRSVAPGGIAYRIAVTFIGDDGKIALSVSEAVWHWLAHPEVSFTAVQRIRAESEGADPEFETAVARAFIGSAGDDVRGE